MDDRQLRQRLRADNDCELTEAGFYRHRNAPAKDPSLGPAPTYRQVEHLLRDRPLRVFDFNMGRADGRTNVFTKDGFDPDYAGDRSDGGEPVYPVAPGESPAE